MRLASSAAPCSAGTGGASCASCRLGTFSPGGSAGHPRPECLVCPSGTNTTATGARTVTKCQSKQVMHLWHICIAGLEVRGVALPTAETSMMAEGDHRATHRSTCQTNFKVQHSIPYVRFQAQLPAQRARAAPTARPAGWAPTHGAATPALPGPSAWRARQAPTPRTWAQPTPAPA